MFKNKKSIFKTNIENKDCTISLEDDYVFCFEADTVIVDVLINDTVITPVVSLNTTPLKGIATVNMDNTISYEATIAVEGDTDFFTYKVIDGDCVDTATVFIVIESELEPLPTYTPITLNKNISGDLGCAISGSNEVNKYIDTGSFASATKLSNDINGVFLAPVGYYTNSIINRYWNGSVFTTTTTC